MRNQFKMRRFFLVLLTVFLTMSSFAQKAKKDKVRLKVSYVKIMDSEINFDFKAVARIKKEYIDVSNIDLIVYNEFEDKKIKVGKTTTNMKGESRFVLRNLNAIKPDLNSVYNFVISFKGNDAFKKASKTISFKNGTNAQPLDYYCSPYNYCPG